jgi:hypothetical protein
LTNLSSTPSEKNNKSGTTLIVLLFAFVAFYFAITMAVLLQALGRPFVVVLLWHWSDSGGFLACATLLFRLLPFFGLSAL